MNIYLQALERTIEEAEDIPQDKKQSLLQKIRELKNDPIIAGFKYAAIAEFVKILLNTKLCA
jgi:hypothetical protein